MAKQTRDIKYLNKNFDDFRSQLVEHAKNYFPETYSDFSPSSPGMLFIETASYVGDVLSFYQDTQLQETFLTHAKDPKNLFNLSYMMGYRPKVTAASEATVEITQIVSASAPTYLPNWSDAATINANQTLKATDRNQTNFFLEEPVDFTFSSSYDPTDVIIDTLDGNNPGTYKLTKTRKVFSAEVITTTFTVGASEKFNTINVNDSNIIEVLSITDTGGDTWKEVPFLGQDTSFEDSTNSSADSNAVPYQLSLSKNPKRFVTRFQADGSLNIQFGAGTNDSDDSVILPDPKLVGNATAQGVRRLDNSYDPSNFLYSKAYGVAPSNTTLTVKYLKGGGIGANVPASTITDKTQVTGTNLTNVSFTNPLPAAGGRNGDTVEELRENALRSFNEQGRLVTLQDYVVRSLSLPSKFGSISKVFATQDSQTNSANTDAIVDNNPLAISLYVLAYDVENKLTTATSTLKNNLKEYLSYYKMVSDSVNIRDAFIVNIGVEYEIVVRPGYSGRDVLLECNLALQDYFKIEKRSINQPINLSTLFSLLDKVKGVQTVQKVKINNKQGGNYAEYAYDVEGATRDNIVYPSYDPCIFEVKFPNTDIVGRVIKL